LTTLGQRATFISISELPEASASIQKIDWLSPTTIQLGAAWVASARTFGAVPPQPAAGHETHCEAADSKTMLVSSPQKGSGDRDELVPVKMDGVEAPIPLGSGKDTTPFDPWYSLA
jgi:hypothetical protein